MRSIRRSGMTVDSSPSRVFVVEYSPGLLASNSAWTSCSTLSLIDPTPSMPSSALIVIFVDVPAGLLVVDLLSVLAEQVVEVDIDRLSPCELSISSSDAADVLGLEDV